MAARLLYLALVVALMGGVGYIIYTAYTDPASITANYDLYLIGFGIGVSALLIAACFSAGRWAWVGLATVTIAASAIFLGWVDPSELISFM